MSLKIVTANRLSDGIAVWLGPNGQWVETVTQARAENDTAGHAALEAEASAAEKSALVVDAVLIDADIVNGGPMPVKLKERIRASGPTVRTDLGKQSDTRAERIA